MFMVEFFVISIDFLIKYMHDNFCIIIKSELANKVILHILYITKLQSCLLKNTIKL